MALEIKTFSLPVGVIPRRDLKIRTMRTPDHVADMMEDLIGAFHAERAKILGVKNGEDIESELDEPILRPDRPDFVLSIDSLCMAQYEKAEASRQFARIMQEACETKNDKAERARRTMAAFLAHMNKLIIPESGGRYKLVYHQSCIILKDNKASGVSLKVGAVTHSDLLTLSTTVFHEGKNVGSRLKNEDILQIADRGFEGLPFADISGTVASLKARASSTNTYFAKRGIPLITILLLKDKLYCLDLEQENHRLFCQKLRARIFGQHDRGGYLTKAEILARKMFNDAEGDGAKPYKRPERRTTINMRIGHHQPARGAFASF